MKKILLLMAALLVSVGIQAQDFSYLRFNSGTGSEQCVSTDGLRIVFNNGNLVATSNDGNATIALSTMNFMYFSNEGGSSQGFLRGDVNRDGNVNVSDVTALINMILGTLATDEEVADVNGDGNINVSDVTVLINIILGIVS